MAIYTYGVIRGSVKFGEVINCIIKRIDEDARIIFTSEDNTIVKVIFSYGNEERLLTCTRNSNDSRTFFNDEEEYILLSLNCWGHSVEIIKTIVSSFGGWVNDNDATNKGYYRVLRERGKLAKYVFILLDILNNASKTKLKERRL